MLTALQALSKQLNDESALLFESRPQKARSKKHFLNLLLNNDPETFLSVAYSNGNVKWFVVAKIMPDDFEKEAINCRPFWIDPAYANKENIDLIKNEIIEFFKKKLTIQIPLLPSSLGLLDTFKDAGFKLGYHYLKGSVRDSLSNLKNRVTRGLPRGYSLKDLDTKRDRKLITDNAIEVLVATPSANVAHLPPSRIRKIFYKAMNNPQTQKHAVGLYYNRKLIGHIMVLIFPVSKHKMMGHIGSVSVLPKYQRQGFSHHLYYAGIKFLNENGVSDYTGLSSTDSVLANIKKMKRRIMLSSLRSR